MSYNVSHNEYVGKGRLKMSASYARKLAKKYEDELPECSFLEDLEDKKGVVEIENPWWYGVGSGYSYDNSLFAILKKTKGSAKILFVWEGGDSQTVLKVTNGKVSKHKAKVGIE